MNNLKSVAHRRFTTNKFLKLALILIAMGPMAANAMPIFTNASFETGTDAGWTVANAMWGPAGGVVNWSTSGPSGIPAMDGIYAVWFGALDNNPGSSYGQTLNGFNVGSSYTVSFGMIPEHGSTSVRDPSRTVATTLLSLVGADVASQSFSADCADPNTDGFFNCAPGWQDMSLTFTALSSTIDFTWTADLASSPFSWEFGFDNVRLALAQSLPEPGTLSLLAIGFAGITWVRRRKLA